MNKIISRRSSCRGCGGAELDLVFSLRPSPIGDAYVTREDVDIVQQSYPIELFMCKVCGLAQLIDVVDPSVLYGDYIYLTASSVGLPDHFIGYAKNVIDRCRINPGSLVVDIGSNDGTLLKSFSEMGMKVLGVEPAKHIAKEAEAKGVETIANFFSPEIAKRIVDTYGRAKLVTANNVVANIDDLLSWVLGVDCLLDEDGVFVFESYYLADVLENMVFDFIYHEHLSSFSVKPVVSIFEKFGLRLVAVERVQTKGGSLRYFIRRNKGFTDEDGSVQSLLEYEQRIGLYDKNIFNLYAEKINLLKHQTTKYLTQAKREGKTIVGFGASITCTTLLYHFEIGDFLEYLVDDNKSKQGRFSPGLHLPVYPSKILCENMPDLVLILAWRFADTIIQNNQDYLNNGGKFLIPVPALKVCQS